jgi:hypothetical protein
MLLIMARCTDSMAVVRRMRVSIMRFIAITSLSTVSSLSTLLAPKEVAPCTEDCRQRIQDAYTMLVSRCKRGQWLCKQKAGCSPKACASGTALATAL